MSIKPAALLASLLSGFGLMTAPAMAEIIQGPYVIEALYPRDTWSGTYDYAGCLVAGKDGTSEKPSLFDWNADANNLCRQPTGPVSKTAIWDIYVVADPPWRSVSVIRSRVNGKCLIRGDGGQASTATLYKWTASGDATYCGFPSLQDFMNNGQAGWDLNMNDVGLDSRGLHMFQGSITMSKPQQAYLDIVPLPLGRPVPLAELNFPAFSTTPSAWKFRLRTVTQYP
jgi:hypothetical protein